VVALREIADETVPLESLEEGLVKGLQKHADTDEPGEEPEMLAIEEELASAASENIALDAAEGKFEDIEEDEDEEADEVEEDESESEKPEDAD
jgi:DNA-directed RNA polymerase subunit omega